MAQAHLDLDNIYDEMSLEDSAAAKAFLAEYMEGLRAAGETLHEVALLVSIANGRQYGSGAQIAPLARPDDGLLEVVLVGARSPWSALWQARRLFDGTVSRIRGVRTLSVQRAELAAPYPLTFHVDGEVFTGGTCLQVRVHPHALRY